MDDATQFQPARGTLVAATLAIAATYFYFLIFTEFALLELAGPIATTDQRVRLLMTVLGMGGIAGSLLAAWRFRLERYPRQLANAFRACGLAAVLALIAQTLPFLLCAVAAAGLALGWLTVTLSAGLRAVVGTRRLGLVAGAGTGLAYAVCNLPPVFTADPRAQTIAAALVVIMAALLGAWLLPEEPSVSPRIDYKPAGVALWVAVFLALVWVDSAGFYVIQHTPELRAATWSGNGQLLANALAHLAGAVVAGVVLDRGGQGRIVAVALAGLVAACLLLQISGVGPGVIYAGAVSLYSTALVYYPARGGRRWTVGVVFAISGWLGSAMGIGMAQQLNRVPPGLLIAAGVVVGGALWLRRRMAGSGALALLAVAGTALDGAPRLGAEDSELLVARGRAVYVSEGCIHCHSQYVRPQVPSDVERWGPAQPLGRTLAEQPPLPGNRRQGPDLADVGNRRTPEWNRLHLLAPRAVTPGSRMPGYAYLFRGDDSRGDALVAYLASLGAEMTAARQARVATWAPSPPGGALAPAKSTRLFTQLCVNCHGEGGRGDGILAGRLSVRPPDWTEEPWRHVPPGAEPGKAVARIIKFGLPGSPMAGHEYLSDAEVIGLARHVLSLHHDRG
ncbi:MAG TPA: cbb3-type cytochrome c oxidase subunit II [Opitutaceae bacterium]